MPHYLLCTSSFWYIHDWRESILTRKFSLYYWSSFIHFFNFSYWQEMFTFFFKRVRCSCEIDTIPSTWWMIFFFQMDLSRAIPLSRACNVQSRPSKSKDPTLNIKRCLIFIKYTHRKLHNRSGLYAFWLDADSLQCNGMGFYYHYFLLNCTTANDSNHARKVSINLMLICL